MTPCGLLSIICQTYINKETKVGQYSIEQHNEYHQETDSFEHPSS